MRDLQTGENMSPELGVGILIGAVAGFALGRAIRVLKARKQEDAAPMTVDDINSVSAVPYEGKALVDSLRGIKVPGTAAKLYRVRVLGLERAKEIAMWGTKGVNHDQPTMFERLADLPVEHLRNILANSPTVTEPERIVINAILEEREALADTTNEVEPVEAERGFSQGF
jgi:hypothetical protein